MKKAQLISEFCGHRHHHFILVGGSGSYHHHITFFSLTQNTRVRTREGQSSEQQNLFPFTGYDLLKYILYFSARTMIDRHCVKLWDNRVIQQTNKNIMLTYYSFFHHRNVPILPHLYSRQYLPPLFLIVNAMSLPHNDLQLRRSWIILQFNMSGVLCFHKSIFLI